MRAVRHQAPARIFCGEFVVRNEFKAVRFTYQRSPGGSPAKEESQTMTSTKRFVHSRFVRSPRAKTERLARLNGLTEDHRELERLAYLNFDGRLDASAYPRLLKLLENDSLAERYCDLLMNEVLLYKILAEHSDDIA